MLVNTILTYADESENDNEAWQNHKVNVRGSSRNYSSGGERQKRAETLKELLNEHLACASIRLHNRVHLFLFRGIPRISRCRFRTLLL